MKNFNERINIIRVISKDDNSSVYLVKDCYDNKIKIMKVLMNKKLSDSFQKEFYILSQLHHPNIIFVEDFGYIEGNKPYFIMEFIKGKNIVDFFKQNSYKKLKDILAQLLLALEFIHSHNLVYSDIKPQNILVKQEDKKIAVKLLDFGLISKKKDFTNKVSGGTLAYIAPEIIQKKIATSQSDLYSIGIVLYEILYGYNPFIDNDPNNIIQNQLNKIPKFDKLPEQSLNKYVAICQKLLQKNPKQRYNSAMEVVKALNKSPIYLFTETQRHRNLSLYYLKGDYLNFQWNEQLIENIKHNIKNNDSSINLIKGNDGTGKSTLLNALKTILQLNHYFTINYKYVQSYDDISNLLNISKLLVFSLNIPYEKFEQLKNNLNKTEQNDEKVYQIFSFYKNVLNKRTREQEYKSSRGQEDKSSRGQEDKNGKARNPIIFILDNADKVPDLLYDWMKYLLESEIKDIHFIISSKEHLPEIFELATKEHKNTLKGSSQRHIDIEEKSTIINEFQLQNLTENEIAPFIQNKLTKCEQIPDKVISYLYKQTNGNLFLLNFLLTNFKQENYLQYKDNKWLFTTPDKIINLPESITKLLKNNFASLTLSQQEMLKFLSVFTITLPYDFLLKCVKTSLRQSLSSLTNNAENEIYYLFNSNWLKKEDDFVRFDSDYKKLFIINNYKTDHNKHYYEISSQMLEQYFQQPSSEILQEIAHHYMKTDKFQKSYDYTMLCGDTNENINKKIYWYEKSLQFAKKLDKNKVFKSIHKLMSAYVKNNQFVKAENLIACYLPSYETDKKTFIRLRAYLANIYFKEEKFSEALRIYKDIYDYYLTDLPEKESFDVLDNYTADLTNLGNYDKAKCIIETYLSTEQNLKKVYVARLKNELGIVMYLKNEPDKALKNYFLALQNLNQYEPSQLKGQIFNNIGGVYIKKGDLINADKYYHKAYKIYNQFNVLWLKYSTLINIATINRMLGNFEKARTYWEESLNYFEFKQSILSLSEIHNNLGSLYFYLGDYSKSKYHFQRTLKLYQKQNNPDTMLMTLNNLVELNFLCRDFVEAEKIIAKVIQLAKKRHNIFELAYSYYFLGKIYLEANNKLAEEIFLNSAELFASINEKDEKLKPQIGLYEIYAKNQDAQSMNLFEEITSNITESPELSLLFLCSLIRLHKLDEFMNLMPNVRIQENKLTAENKWQYHFFIGIHNQENNSLEDAIYHYKVAMEIIKEMWDKLDEQSKQNYLNDKLKIELKDRMDRTFCNYSI